MPAEKNRVCVEGRFLTRAEFRRLSDVPPELEWCEPRQREPIVNEHGRKRLALDEKCDFYEACQFHMVDSVIQSRTASVFWLSPQLLADRHPQPSGIAICLWLCRGKPAVGVFAWARRGILCSSVSC